MVEVFGAKSAVHFSPKDLGLNVRLRGYFWTVRSWIMRLIFGLSMCTFLCVLLKVNNMCSCENLVVICSIYVLAWIA